VGMEDLRSLVDREKGGGEMMMKRENRLENWFAASVDLVRETQTYATWRYFGSFSTGMIFFSTYSIDPLHFLYPYFALIYLLLFLSGPARL
jgi:hypothetical protein